MTMQAYVRCFIASMYYGCARELAEKALLMIEKCPLATQAEINAVMDRAESCERIADHYEQLSHN